MEQRIQQRGTDSEEQEDGEEEDWGRSLLLWIVCQDSKFCQEQKEETEGAQQSQ